MTETDIVERLRQCEAMLGKDAPLTGTFSEAADEITRLRADLAYADEQAKKLEAIAWPSFELNERLRAALRFWIEAYRTHQHEPLVIAYESTLNRFPELGTSAALEGRDG